MLPEVPITVTANIPMAAVAPALSVRVVEVGSGLEVKEAVTPLGNPVAENATFPAKPF